MKASTATKTASKVVELSKVGAETKLKSVETEVPKEVATSPLYGVAMLKIAMELKKADPLPLDELISGVLKRMNLPEAQFREFLSHNGGLLRTIAQGKRF